MITYHIQIGVSEANGEEIEQIELLGFTWCKPRETDGVNRIYTVTVQGVERKDLIMGFLDGLKGGCLKVVQSLMVETENEYTIEGDGVTVNYQGVTLGDVVTKVKVVKGYEKVSEPARTKKGWGFIGLRGGRWETVKLIEKEREVYRGLPELVYTERMRKEK